MADADLLRAEVAHMSDREILLLLLDGQRTQNGAIAALHGDYYGDPERKITGTKGKVEAHELAIDRGRTTIRTVLAVLGLLGVGNIVAVLTVVAR